MSESIAQFEGTDGLLGHVVRLNIAVERVLNEIAGTYSLSVADYLVLGVIRRSPEHRSAPTAICEILGRTTGGMTLTLDRLESAGYIRRLPDPSDRRRVVVEATPTGIELAQKVNAHLHAWEESLELSADQRRSVAEGLAVITQAIVTAPSEQTSQVA